MVIPIVGAALVAALRQWWAPALGAVVAAFLLIGLLVTGQARGQLSDPSDVGIFAGTAVLFLGLIMALVFGSIATVLNRRTVDDG